MKKISLLLAPLMVTPFLFGCGANKDTTIYHVKFTNGNQVVGEKDYKKNETIVAPNDPTPEEGYTFDGWFDNQIKYEVGLKATRNYNFVAAFSEEEEQYTMNFYEDEDKQELCESITITESSPTFTTPEHEVTITGYVGKWRYDVDLIVTTISTYVDPDEQLDFTDTLPQLKQHGIDHLDFIWNELEKYSAKFKNASEELIPADEIFFTEADFSFKFPAAPDEQEGYKWYNEEEDRFYNPGEDFVFKSLIDPHDYKDYEFIWKKEGSTVQYTITFLDSDETEMETQTIPIGSSEFEIVFPAHEDTGDDWGWHTDDIYELSLEYFSGSGEAKVTIPLESFDDITFKWEQNPNP